MADNNDDIVSQFMAFSGCADASQAASYLEMSGGNLETAVGLYMEHQGGGAGASGGGEDAVRAPDATQRMQLMDDHHGGLLHPAAGALPAALRMDPALRMMHEMMENELEAAQRSAFSEHIVPDARAAVNAAAAEQKENEEDDDDEYNYDDDDDDNDEVQVVQEPPRLADMFAPPSYRFTTGGFANAKTTAKDSKRWLLVNVQRDDEFSSHALNRDVWGDELIENLISEGFVFWQVMDSTTEGRTFTERYQVQDFPHVSILDPRTGRLLWRKEGWTQEKPLTSESLAEYIMDFCSSNTFDRPPQAPRPGGARPPTKRPIEDLTEDEQIQAAMRASVEQVSANDEAMKDDDDDDVKEVAKPSFNDELVGMQVGDEPASGGARIQLRMPNGKRVVRKFAVDATVKTIYAFVAQSDEEARGGREFQLQAGFPPKDLWDDMDKTVDECKLSGEAITVRWKE